MLMLLLTAFVLLLLFRKTRTVAVILLCSVLALAFFGIFGYHISSVSPQEPIGRSISICPNLPYKFHKPAMKTARSASLLPTFKLKTKLPASLQVNGQKTRKYRPHIPSQHIPLCSQPGLHLACWPYSDCCFWQDWHLPLPCYRFPKPAPSASSCWWSDRS